MEPVAAILGSWAISKVADTVWSGAGTQVQGWLKRTDVEQAMGAAKRAVQQWEKDLSPPQYLFFHCEERLAHQFLDRVLTTAIVQEELLRPLQHEGQPDLPVLIDAFTRVATTMSVKLNQPALEPWLKQFIEAYFAQTSAALRFQLAKRRYLDQLVTLCDDVKLLGVAVEGREEEKQKTLVQIFVMPDLEESQRGGRLELFADERPDQRPELPQALRGQSKQRFSAGQLLGQTAQRTVILGAPGSGKTTLLNYFVVKLAAGKATELQMPEADWLPILIRIRDWVEHPDRSLLEHAYAFCERLSIGKLPEGFFDYWLTRGRAVVLLDGLDEVADEAKRSRIAEEIELFLQQHHQNPAVITSRPAGYRSYFRSESFPHYELQPFDERQMEEFVDHWYDSRTAGRQEAELGKASLRRALKDSPRIKLLAKNPLLLTIVALIHRYEAYLPKQRHELYERAVKTLLTSWDKGKGFNSELSAWDLEYLRHDDLLLLLRQLAYWVHTQGSAEDGDGGTLIDKDELVRQLSRLIKAMKQIELHYAQQEAERLVNFIRSRTGLLNEQGQDCYAFVHKTFQEYLTAEEIHYQHECEDEFEIVLDHIQVHLHDPHWREVLLLLVSRQVGKRAAKAIRKVLTHGSDYEQWLHRDLLFAADCLAENSKGLNTADPELATEILEQLIELEMGDGERVSMKVQSEVQRIFCGFRDTAFQTQVLDLLKAQKNIDEMQFRTHRAALGEEDLIIQLLLVELQDVNPDRRGSAAKAFGELNNSSDSIIHALSVLLQDEELRARECAIATLGKLSKNSDLGIQILLMELQSVESNTRRNIVYALGETDNRAENVLQALLAAIQDNDNNVRYAASLVLGRRVSGSESIISALLVLLQSEDAETRWNAALALSISGSTSETVLQILLAELESEDAGNRWGSAYALGHLESQSEVITNALLKALKDEEMGVRLNASHALQNSVNNSVNNSEIVLQDLLIALQDQETGIRNNAAYALGKLVNVTEPVVLALLNTIQDESLYVRESAAESLGKLGKTSAQVREAVIQWIEQNQDSEFVGRGIDALWGIVQE